MSLRMVRTTINPDLDLQVTETEYRDLTVLGILLPGYTGEDYAGEIPASKLPRGARANTTEDQEG